MAVPLFSPNEAKMFMGGEWPDFRASLRWATGGAWLLTLRHETDGRERTWRIRRSLALADLECNLPWAVEKVDSDYARQDRSMVLRSLGYVLIRQDFLPLAGAAERFPVAFLLGSLMAANRAEEGFPDALAHSFDDEEWMAPYRERLARLHPRRPVPGIPNRPAASVLSECVSNAVLAGRGYWPQAALLLEHLEGWIPTLEDWCGRLEAEAASCRPVPRDFLWAPLARMVETPRVSRNAPRSAGAQIDPKTRDFLEKQSDFLARVLDGTHPRLEASLDGWLRQTEVWGQRALDSLFGMTGRESLPAYRAAVRARRALETAEEPGPEPVL
jgi:hypothetical protein